MKIALALGGGGARGIAHIGVLKVLEERGFRPDIIVGTSIGSIVGAKYAQVLSWKVIWIDVKEALSGEAFKKAGLELFDEEKKNPFQEFMSVITKGVLYSKAIISTSLVSEKAYMDAIRDFFKGESLIEETRIPFAAVALDIVSGEEVVINRGSVIKAVAASSAIPGVFPPVRHEKKVLVDGGWIDMVPAMAARLMGADLVIGVSVSKGITSLGADMGNSFDIVSRADEITRYYLAAFRKNECDYVIEPDVADFMWNDFDKTDEIFEKGVEAAFKAWDDLSRFLRYARFKSIFKRKKRSLPSAVNVSFCNIS